jgi:hypothetical protein
MPLYTFIHNLLNVLVQIANKMGLQTNSYVFWYRTLFCSILPLTERSVLHFLKSSRKLKWLKHKCVKAKRVLIKLYGSKSRRVGIDIYKRSDLDNSVFMCAKIVISKGKEIYFL